MLSLCHASISGWACSVALNSSVQSVGQLQTSAIPCKQSPSLLQSSVIAGHVCMCTAMHAQKPAWLIGTVRWRPVGTDIAWCALNWKSFMLDHFCDPLVLPHAAHSMLGVFRQVICYLLLQRQLFESSPFSDSHPARA